MELNATTIGIILWIVSCIGTFLLSRRKGYGDAGDRKLLTIGSFIPYIGLITFGIAICATLYNKYCIPKYIRKTIALMIKRKDFEIEARRITNKALNIRLEIDGISYGGNGIPSKYYSPLVRKLCPVYNEPDTYQATYEMYKQKKAGA